MQNSNPFSQAQGIKEKRVILLSLTRDAREIQKKIIAEAAEEAEGDFLIPRVNQIILEMFKENEDLQFKTFMQWKKEGFSVKKGAKAY